MAPMTPIAVRLTALRYDLDRSANLGRISLEEYRQGLVALKGAWKALARDQR
jgi:hypothetical protein